MSLRDYMGRVEILTVARIASFGYFLTIEEEDEDVLLHFSETDQKFEEGMKSAFLYIVIHREELAQVPLFRPLQ